MKKNSFFILLLIGLTACKTNQAYLNVMEPAPVTMPSYVKSVGIINRSMPATKRDRRIDNIDKVLSMEGVDLDKDAAKESVRGLGDELIRNNRFTEVKTLNMVHLGTTGAGVFPSSLPWEKVEEICKENNVDALFALEMFDTDSKISYTSRPDTIKAPGGKKIPVIEHQASMLTTVRTGWRIYDPQSRSIVDEYSLSRNVTLTGKGINPAVAAAAIIGRKEAVNRIGNEAGKIYANRIIPYWTRVSREYYVKGNSSFESATRKAKTGNWDGAAEIWKKETKSADKKIAGRACYNMAIASEIKGSLDVAIEWAQKAYEDYGDKMALKYVNILRGRKASNDKLQQQLEE